MDQEKVGKIIKKIRQDNNLTQQAFADKLGVTYQAVSKWETGKGLPDIVILKEISKIYNIDLNVLLDGKQRSKKIYYFYLSLIVIIIAVSIFFIIKNRNQDFKFKTISTTCASFNITGSIAYNNSKSSIYISDVNYCGGNDDTKYQKVECTLFENENNNIIKISSYNYAENVSITLEEFLKQVKFTISNYQNKCQNFTDNSLYIEIKAYNDDNKLTNYKIPLTLKDT